MLRRSFASRMGKAIGLG